MLLTSARVETTEDRAVGEDGKTRSASGFCGGERGIRTPGTLAGTTVFKTDAIVRSAISPTHILAADVQRQAGFTFRSCPRR